MASKTRKRKSRTKRGLKKRGTSVFVKTQRSQRVSSMRKRERDRVANRLSGLLAPESEQKRQAIKRRKRGPKKFRRTVNTLQGISRNTHKADVFRREATRVVKSVGALAIGLKAVSDFLGLSRAEARIASRL